MAKQEKIIDAARERAERHKIAEMELYKGDKCNYSYGRIYDAEIVSFEAGAQWADKHPDISSLWHDAKEMPNYGSAYIAIDNNNHIWLCEKSLISSQTLWNDIAPAQKIYKWMYIADILPKGGDK